VDPVDSWWLVADSFGNYWQAQCDKCRIGYLEGERTKLLRNQETLIRTLTRIRQELDEVIWQAA